MSHPLSVTSPKQIRQPPPSLFLGPPSRNASHVSIPPGHPTNTGASSIISPTSNNQRTPLLRNRPNLNQISRPDEGLDASSLVSPLRSGPRPQRQQLQDDSRKQADRTDELWAEMQRTLQRVELSAVSETHVFGDEHSKALEGLRTAQIALAQAWARSEADDATETASAETMTKVKEPLSANAPPASQLTGETAAGAGGPGALASSTGKDAMGGKAEEETASDIVAARKRREANDRYFQRVNGGVLDVVSKLEDVAVAMKSVQQESRDIWSETEGSVSGSAS